ncbi:MAG: DUF1295 domain-containing protein [Halioglobus sp.]
MSAIIFIHALAAAFTWLCSSGSALVWGIPALACCALFIFALQWLAFIPAYLRQTERYYDLVGSLTYMGAVFLALLLSTSHDARSLLLAVLITVWAVRLGSFLFRRISEQGHDSRFDRIKPNAVLFFRTWSLQGLWVLVTAGAALTAITSPHQPPLGLLDMAGAALWLFGFAIEVVADRQKRQFRRSQGEQGFIDVGLWSRSRHPNYFGEIVLWAGIALMAAPALTGWQYVALVSPLFVYVLLTRISGVPLLERKADRRWGDDPGYTAYKANTPVLVPRLFRAAR